MADQGLSFLKRTLREDVEEWDVVLENISGRSLSELMRKPKYKLAKIAVVFGNLKPMTPEEAALRYEDAYEEPIKDEEVIEALNMIKEKGFMKSAGNGYVLTRKVSKDMLRQLLL